MYERILAQPTAKASKTQKERVLERLQNGECLSVRQIINEMWINSPTKVVSDLCKDGYDIKKRKVKTNHSHYIVYHMGEWKE